MGLLRGLLGLGMAAGAAFAAVKVAQKYDENRAADAEAYDAAAEAAEANEAAYDAAAEAVEANEAAYDAAAEAAEANEAAYDTTSEAAPQEVTIGDVLRNIGRAAGDVLVDAGTRMKEAAQKAGVDTDELKEAFHGAGSAVAHAGGAVVDYMKQEAPGVVENVREGAKDVLSHVKDAVSNINLTVDFDADEDDDTDEEEAADAWAVVTNTQAAADAAQAEADAAQAEADVAQAKADAAQAEADAAWAEADAAQTVHTADEDEEYDEDK